MDTVHKIFDEWVQLNEEKKRVERNMSINKNVLDSNKVDMKSRLVDTEGFPRNDIDIPSITSAKHKINSNYSNDIKTIKNPPFLLVKSIDVNGPAFEYGLRKDDKITDFGSINKKNYRCLNDIALVARQNENKILKVHYQRREQYQKVSLTPKKWNGNGLLGCFVVEIKD
ncbi:26S proteasome non-ATPase regulatory subunit 9 [Intoshia linei]|uniref:26S proteasome non-ATPase regulatory subunit 9 n=1 Tax=Intoshia linei TaxID=1819745 RepID=A0A177BAJ4_9BILA|nr:26S proteasome non-ATPase regulatory subunit 9 [Intoshia linei]